MCVLRPPLAVSQMTHYTMHSYMHYVLNHVVYAFYNVICHPALESDAPPPSLHKESCDSKSSASHGYLKCFFFLFLEFSMWTHTIYTTKWHRIVHTYLNWDAP